MTTPEQVLEFATSNRKYKRTNLDGCVITSDLKMVHITQKVNQETRRCRKDLKRLDIVEEMAKVMAKGQRWEKVWTTVMINLY